MARVLLIGALVLAAFWVYSIVDCALSVPNTQRGVRKGWWIAIVALIPVIGGVLWFTIGRPRGVPAARSQAPDDDPEFLGRIGTSSDQDERIRRLEEELAALDAEADSPLDAGRPDVEKDGSASSEPEDTTSDANDDSDDTDEPSGRPGPRS